jgi:hypothetical protein
MSGARAPDEALRPSGVVHGGDASHTRRARAAPNATLTTRQSVLHAQLHASRVLLEPKALNAQQSPFDPTK